MYTVKAQSRPASGQTVSDEYRSYVYSRIPALGRLLDALDAGTTPNFLDVMAALSDLVAFYTECDTLESGESVRFCEMSGKKCLFCC